MTPDVASGEVPSAKDLQEGGVKAAADKVGDAAKSQSERALQEEKIKGDNLKTSRNPKPLARFGILCLFGVFCFSSALCLGND